MWLFLFEYYEYIQMIIFDVEANEYFCTVIDVFRQCKCLNLDEYLCMRSATSTTILQHFNNKSWVVNYYWFKFEFSTKITFLT